MSEILLLIILIGLAWFWQDSIAKRELAVAFGRDIAQRFNLQLLDESVACSRIRLGRDRNGQAQLLRFYEFDVSADGVTRMDCQLELLGKQLQNWHVPPYVQAMH
jgi:hypothetical protein